jgi:hypothetical protein
MDPNKNNAKIVTSYAPALVQDVKKSIIVLQFASKNRGPPTS